MTEKKYLTEDEIVDDLLSRMDENERESWVKRTDGELVMSRHFTGRAIRNEYYLWEEDNPYTVIDVEPNEEGLIDHPLFPDQVSHRIMTKIRDKINEEKNNDDKTK
jgi:hypothetical protein